MPGYKKALPSEGFFVSPDIPPGASVQWFRMDCSRQRLEWIAKANIVLGVVSIVRLIIEIQFFWSTRNLSRHAEFAAFDLAVGSLWVASGLCLLSRHTSGLAVAAIAAGMAAARSLISVMLLGPGIAQGLWQHRNDPAILAGIAFVGSRLLHYAIELVYWPFVLFLVLKASERQPRSPGDPELRTGIAFAISGCIAAMIEGSLIMSMS